MNLRKKYKELQFTDPIELEYFSFLEHKEKLTLETLREFAYFIEKTPSSVFSSIPVKEFSDKFTYEELKLIMTTLKSLYKYTDGELKTNEHPQAQELQLTQESFEGLSRINFFAMRSALNKILKPVLLGSTSKIRGWGDKFEEKEKIKVIEFLENEYNTDRLKYFINKDYTEEKHGKGKGWQILYSLAGKQSPALSSKKAKEIADYFNTNKKNPLYSKGEFALTKILTTTKENTLRAEKGTKLEIISRKKLAMRKKK